MITCNKKAQVRLKIIRCLGNHIMLNSFILQLKKEDKIKE